MINKPESAKKSVLEELKTAATKNPKVVLTAESFAAVIEESAALLAENKRLRALLCRIYAGPRAYLDDGEMQDNSAKPHIDFKRDSVDAIEDKMRSRFYSALKDFHWPATNGRISHEQ